jgi:hypothetical protein
MTEEGIFAAALKKHDRAERAAFLDQACAGDLALRKSVEELLQAHERLGGPLHSESELEGTDQPFLGTTRPLDRLVQPLSEEPGSRVGPYKLL